MEGQQYGAHWRESNNSEQAKYSDRYLPSTAPETSGVSHLQISPVTYFPYYRHSPNYATSSYAIPDLAILKLA
jgi:hypothetical protein